MDFRQRGLNLGDVAVEHIGRQPLREADQRRIVLRRRGNSHVQQPVIPAVQPLQPADRISFVDRGRQHGRLAAARCQIQQTARPVAALRKPGPFQQFDRLQRRAERMIECGTERGIVVLATRGLAQPVERDIAARCRQADALAAAPQGGGQRLRAGADQHQVAARRRFLDGLQQRVDAVDVQRIGRLDDRDLRAAVVLGHRQLFAEQPDLLDRDVALAFLDLHREVAGMRAAGNLQAVRALATGRAVASQLAAPQRSGDAAGEVPLAGAVRPGQQQRMAQPLLADRTGDRGPDLALPRQGLHCSASTMATSSAATASTSREASITA